MARINIEERWWNDPRRRTLRILLARDATEQVVVNAWRTACDYWCNKNGSFLVPGEVFIHFDGWKELILSGLATLYNCEQVDSTTFRTNVEHLGIRVEHNPTDPAIVKQCFVYLNGMRETFASFLENRTKKSAAGRKSAAKRAKLYGTAQPKLEHTPNTIQHSPNTIQHTSNTPDKGKITPHSPPQIEQKTDENDPKKDPKSDLLTEEVNRNSNTFRTQSNTAELSISSSSSFSSSFSKKKKNNNAGIRLAYPPEFEVGLERL
jgi:hypothetical protein